MRKNEVKPFVLCILCLGLLLTGTAVADESVTYGAYPGAPTQATTQVPTPAISSVATPEITTAPLPATTTVPSSASTATALYSTQAPAVAQQNSLLAYDILTSPPSAVYYEGTYLPWTSFYQVFPKNSPALWISSNVGWSWYASCPMGGWVQELMYVPATGTMKVYDLYPDGTTKYYSYGFATPGYKLRWFYADAPGRYLTMLTISDIPSNYIIMDVA